MGNMMLKLERNRNLKRSLAEIVEQWRIQTVDDAAMALHAVDGEDNARYNHFLQLYNE